MKGITCYKKIFERISNKNQINFEIFAELC